MEGYILCIWIKLEDFFITHETEVVRIMETLWCIKSAGVDRYIFIHKNECLVE